MEPSAQMELAVSGAEVLPGPTPERPVAQDSLYSLAIPDEREAWRHLSVGSAGNEPLAPTSGAERPGLLEVVSPPSVADGEGTSRRPDEATRPFTDFIEEFRQTEGRLVTRLGEVGTPFLAFAPGSEMLQPAADFQEAAGEDRVHAGDSAFAPDESGQEKHEAEEKSGAAVPPNTPEETPPVPPQPVERPVSPLLRPPRVRLPRHSRHRVEQQVAPPAEVVEEEPEKAAESPLEGAPAVEEIQVEEQPARPARRYRFDRPAATASASLSTGRISALPPSSRLDEIKEKKSAGPATHKENSAMNADAAASRVGAGGAVSEAPVQKVQVQETASAAVEATPAPVERRRKGNNHERQREKEQPVVSSPTTPVQEPAPLTSDVVADSQAEIAVEDLPPLEYSELQAASSRRRRRRRAGSASVTAAANGALSPRTALPEPPVPPQPAAPPLPRTAAPAQPQPAYNIVSGYTINQMNQGNDTTGPFMGPEPSPARGSTFSTPPTLRQMRNDALRTTSAHPAKHAENPLMSAASVNYLANAVAQAIQAQTDRMVAEWRRVSQAPTNVSVSLPPFPSTERVGVFVDVANLLYSARTLRMTIDFGKLLDFLRGNRRLVRAQAYCPTSPQPGDDQMFLQAVKGLGYRITTKNYKTFSSGAKKADLDLDLCMDVVRLVDGNAVDCIVLVSGDSDFMPMLDYCSDHGVRVEVAAFDESMSATLRQSCDLFVNLSMLEEIRA
ncbi:MAG TPA: NYN domain-containing protein [Ktedonobacteraceae bacterium]